jgi:2-polyprenyl-3-methyl-5-hydroxy-6-metoxy-1,4-benzoquinol methylase
MNIEKLRRKYAKHYRLRQVTAEQMLYHWNSERQLRRELLAAPAESRWQAFDEGYSRHYRELTWLQQPSPTTCNWQEWLDLVGQPAKKIFEIGSGRGALIKALAAAGHECTATEITRERGERWVEHTNIRWHTTDGVHLERFEPAGSYDVVVSNQVIEHMHPDDLQAHFQGVHAILRPEGRYVLATPHRFTGPCDISCVFGSSTCEGQHLKEYTYREISQAARFAGFREVAASLRFPHAVRHLGDLFKARLSRLYQNHLEALETMIGTLPAPLTRPLSRLARLIYFRPTIYLAARK